MGSFVLLIHDFADHWLELAKLAKYAGKEVIKCQLKSILHIAIVKT